MNCPSLGCVVRVTETRQTLSPLCYLRDDLLGTQQKEKGFVAVGSQSSFKGHRSQCVMVLSTALTSNWREIWLFLDHTGCCGNRKRPDNLLEEETLPTMEPHSVSTVEGEGYSVKTWNSGKLAAVPVPQCIMCWQAWGQPLHRRKPSIPS